MASSNATCWARPRGRPRYQRHRHGDPATASGLGTGDRGDARGQTVSVRITADASDGRTREPGRENPSWPVAVEQKLRPARGRVSTHPCDDECDHLPRILTFDHGVFGSGILADFRQPVGEEPDLDRHRRDDSDVRGQAARATPAAFGLDAESSALRCSLMEHVRTGGLGNNDAQAAGAIAPAARRFRDEPAQRPPLPKRPLESLAGPSWVSPLQRRTLSWSGLVWLPSSAVRPKRWRAISEELAPISREPPFSRSPCAPTAASPPETRRADHILRLSGEQFLDVLLGGLDSRVAMLWVRAEQLRYGPRPSSFPWLPFARKSR